LPALRHLGRQFRKLPFLPLLKPLPAVLLPLLQGRAVLSGSLGLPSVQTLAFPLFPLLAVLPGLLLLASLGLLPLPLALRIDPAGNRPPDSAQQPRPVFPQPLLTAGPARLALGKLPGFLPVAPLPFALPGVPVSSPGQRRFRPGSMKAGP